MNELDLEAQYVDAFNQLQAILPIWDLFVDHYQNNIKKVELSQTGRAEIKENLEEMNGYIQALTANRSYYMEPVPSLLLKIRDQVDKMFDKTDDLELLELLNNIKQTINGYLKYLPPYYQQQIKGEELRELTDEERALQAEISRILEKPYWYNEELRKRALDEILKAGTQGRPLNPENVKIDLERDPYKLEKVAYEMLQQLKQERAIRESKEGKQESSLAIALNKSLEELTEERKRLNRERLTQAPDGVTEAANKILRLELKKLNLL
jgi:hypothetical protein